MKYVAEMMDRKGNPGVGKKNNSLQGSQLRVKPWWFHRGIRFGHGLSGARHWGCTIYLGSGRELSSLQQAENWNKTPCIILKPENPHPGQESRRGKGARWAPFQKSTNLSHGGSTLMTQSPPKGPISQCHQLRGLDLYIQLIFQKTVFRYTCL